MAISLARRADAQGAISGTILDSAARPIPNVEVLIPSLDRRVRTDSTGRFTIGALKAARYVVRARRFGYFPADGEVRVRDGVTSAIKFELSARPVLLDTVTVTSSCARFEFGGFLCRQRKGTGGTFLDVDQIDSANARFPADLFRRPGFRVEAVRGGLAPRSLTGWRCLNTIVNGKPVGFTNPMPRWPNEIIGLEIYADPDSVPPEYSQFIWGSVGTKRPVSARCSLANYWTTVRSRR